MFNKRPAAVVTDMIHDVDGIAFIDRRREERTTALRL